MGTLDPTCNFCGQEIRWKEDKGGHFYPVNEDGEPHIPTCSGNPMRDKPKQAQIDAASTPQASQEAQTPKPQAPAPKEAIAPKTQGKAFSALDIAEVTKVTGIPRGFIMLMGEPGKERPFVLGEGLLYKGERKGYRSIQIEIEQLGDAKGQPLGFKAKATLWPKLKREDYEVLKHLPQDPATAKLVLEELSRPFIDYGTATADNVKMRTMLPYLRELASTRARNRVLRLFTACGLTSVEELEEAEIVESE